MQAHHRALLAAIVAGVMFVFLNGYTMAVKALMPRPQDVLYVDDDAAELQLIEIYLRPYDITFRGEADAKIALDLVAKEWFDVILVDQRMPQMSGLHFIHTAEPKNRNAYFYILTGFPDSHTLLEASKGHCWLIWKDKVREQFEILFDRKPNGRKSKNGN